MKLVKFLLFISFIPASIYSFDLSDVSNVIEAFAPLVKFAKGERYFPSSMPWYIDRVALKDKDNQTLVPLGQLKPADLITYNSSDNYLDPDGVEETYRGEPLEGNTVIAPCYINYVHNLEEQNGKKSGRAILQAIFHLPYNEPTPLKQLIKILELLNIKSVGSHEGDIENVDIFLRQEDDRIFIEQIFFARHGDAGGYLYADELEFEYGHPIVYTAQFGHASYGHAIPVFNYLADSADGKGARWECWKHYELLNWDNPTSVGQEWLLFKGRIGTDKSKNPKSKAIGQAVKGFQRGSKWYYNANVRKKLLGSVTIKQGSGRSSDNFTVKPDQRHHTLLWEIDGSHVPSSLSYNVMKDIPWWPDKKLLSLQGQLDQTRPISDENIYISQLKGGSSGVEYTLRITGLS